MPVSPNNCIIASHSGQGAMCLSEQSIAYPTCARCPHLCLRHTLTLRLASGTGRCAHPPLRFGYRSGTGRCAHPPLRFGYRPSAGRCRQRAKLLFGQTLSGPRLYLTGYFSRDMLVGRKMELETTIDYLFCLVVHEHGWYNQDSTAERGLKLCPIVRGVMRP
jgi:hypothetical protein